MRICLVKSCSFAQSANPCLSCELIRSTVIFWYGFVLDSTSWLISSTDIALPVYVCTGRVFQELPRDHDCVYPEVASRIKQTLFWLSQSHQDWIQDVAWFCVQATSDNARGTKSRVYFIKKIMLASILTRKNLQKIHTIFTYHLVSPLVFYLPHSSGLQIHHRFIEIQSIQKLIVRLDSNLLYIAPLGHTYMAE